MSEQLPKEESDYVPALMKASNDMSGCYLDWANLCQGAAEYISDLRASLRREENARKVLADENNRLRQMVFGHAPKQESLR